MPAGLSFDGITHQFASPDGEQRLTVLDGISLDVAAGEFVAVIGPSGCGKSTLIRMAAGLLRPTRGTVRHDGVVVDGVNHAVGLVPQQALLFPWKTLLENVALPLVLRGVPAAERDRRARAALAAVDLAGFDGYYPHQLSGGMQKRGSIARTMVYRPDALLMDEPFGALDAQTRMLMQDDLQRLTMATPLSVLFVTHDITEAILLADAVVVLSRRPSRVLARVEVGLARPRNVFAPFADPRFAPTYERVWSAFKAEIGARPAVPA